MQEHYIATQEDVSEEKELIKDRGGSSKLGVAPRVLPRPPLSPHQ